MARGGKVVIRDRGWTRIKTDVEALHGRGVKVGIRAGSGSNDGVPIVQYAVFQEYGTDTIPARPFLKRAVDTSEREIASFGRSLAAGIIAGRINAEVALDRLGLWFSSRIQDSISSARSWAEPLAASTIRRKGSSAPLIDKGMLRAAVSYSKERSK